MARRARRGGQYKACMKRELQKASRRLGIRTTKRGYRTKAKVTKARWDKEFKAAIRKCKRRG